MGKAKSRLFGLLAALILAVSLTGLCFSAAAEGEPVSGYGVVMGDDASHWTVTNEGTAEETITANGGDSYFRNFLVRSDVNAVGDYEVTAVVKGTKSSPYTEDIQIGIIPWYLDDNNYIMTYMHWNGEKNVMRCVEITGKVNGMDPVVWSDGFIQRQWNDIWMDHHALGVKTPSDELQIKAVKRLSEARDTDIIEFFINGQSVGFYSFRDTVKYAGIPAKAGLYVSNDTVTVTGFAVSPKSGTPSASIFKSDGTYVSRSGGTANAWTVAGQSFTADASAGGVNDNLLIYPNPYKAGNYSLAANVTASGGGDRGIGFAGYYQDDYNFLNAYVATVSGQTKAVIEGKFTEEKASQQGSASVENLVTAVSESADLTVPFEEITSLKVEKVGNSLALFVNEQSEAAVKVSNLSGITVGKELGLIAFGSAAASFTSVTASELTYNPYDWFTQVVDGKTFYVSSAEADSVTFESAAAFSIAVDEKETEKTAGLYTASGRYGNVGASAVFTVADQGSYGLYGWLENAENNLKVTVSPDGIKAEYKFGEKTGEKAAALPADFTYAGEHSLALSVKDNSVAVKLDDAEVITGFAVEGNDVSLSPYAGVFAAGKEVNVASFAISGFSPYDPITEGEWTFYGARTNSWNMTDDKITGSYAGSTAFQRTIALINNGAADFYYGAKITVTSTTMSEWKTGLMPYYLDSGNYVFVWLSQWSGAATSITVTAKLNGKVVGSEWREQEAAFTHIGAPHEVEVQIEGDSLKVFMNKSVAPVFTTTIDGFSQRNLAGAKVGLNVFNTAADFEEIQVSEDRIFVNREKPVISETGSRKTEAKVGDTITLPIFTASNTAGDVLNPVVKVTGPDGVEIEPVKNKFTVSAKGTYTVTVTCVDQWGNHADEVSYTITVADAEKAKSGGCGTVGAAFPGAGGMLGGGLLISALAFSLLLFRRKKA